MIQDQSTVTMHYTLSVDGQEIGSTYGENGNPLEFKMGEGAMFPHLEQQLVGLKQGDKKSVTLSPDQAFGPVDPNAKTTVPKDAFENGDTLKPGSPVQGESPQGKFEAIVTKVDENEVTLDLNHPLAGRELKFDIEIVAIQ